MKAYSAKRLNVKNADTRVPGAATVKKQRRHKERGREKGKKMGGRKKG